MTAFLDDAPEARTVQTPLPASGVLFRRTFLWSVLRELWEHRALYLAPATVGALVFLGYLIGTLTHGAHTSFQSGLDDTRRMTAPFDFAAVAVLMTMLVVGLFYSLGALFNERRDRTILFWKSLPVSDLTTVLSKAVIPLVVLPVIAFVVILVLQLAMLLVGSAALVSSGGSPGFLWAQEASFPGWVLLAYSLMALSLWHAPIYGWLLLVSAWAKRSPFLWALLPPLAVSLIEKFGFNTSYVFRAVMDRFGGFTRAYAPGAFSGGSADLGSLKGIDPVGFFSDPGLWEGLVVAAAFLAAAVWLRRRREAI